MAYQAVMEFKRLSNRERSYSRKKYTLEQAEEKIQQLIGDGKVEIKNLLELKRKCLHNARARKELTDTIYYILVEYGIEVEGIESIREAAEVLFAEIYGFSIFQPYMDSLKYNEVYSNGWEDNWGIIGLDRQPLPIKFRDENHAMKLLERLTMNSREGKAAHDNRLNSAMLSNQSRLRWALPPLADEVSFNIRKHSEEDMKSITLEKFLQDGVMTKPVYALLAGMAITGTFYGILGPGGVGKTALLRVILREVHEVLRPRFLVSENGAELQLKHYLKTVGCTHVDVNALQKWSGAKEDLSSIFANFMQAKGEFIIQPEILMAEEVDNILMASRRGHVMGPCTFHSSPEKFLDALADLYLQRYQADRGAVLRMLANDVLASCHYDIEYSHSESKRRIMGVYEYVDGKDKPILFYDGVQYQSLKIENKDLHKKMSTLEFKAPHLFEEVKHLL